ncbi:hybrid sensor histidine kinase/response regulator [Roseivirga sp. BDSF3-8]|uniref:ATP-binding response regulator n=1 Tax=Roseivirga sp. BDSF3-8 TaxID=3241598 RepID=UPI003532708D
MCQKVILVADQNPGIIDQLNHILDQAGYQVISTGKYHQVIPLAKKHLPDLILLEWEIETSATAALITALKESVKTEHIPIITTLGLEAKPNALKSIFVAGASDFIRKPLESTELIFRIKTTLQSKKNLQELRDSNHTKSRLLAVVSHELRSPLSSFQGILTYLKNAGKDQLSIATVYRLIMDVEEEFSTVVNLANNLLFWALEQEDAIQVYEETFDLATQLKQTKQIFSLPAKEKDIEIRLNITENLLIRSDVNLVSFIIRNLIANAIKFSPSGREVIIEVSRDYRNVVIHVSDSGPGLDEDTLNNLFHHIAPSRATPDKYGKNGAGLGLAVAYDFTRKVGGYLSVSSEPGRGSTFTLTLPIKVKEEVLSI